MVKKKTSLIQDVDKLYQDVKSGNYFGIASIAFGIVSIISAGMSAIIGITLAIIGLVKKEKKIYCIIGILLSILGLFGVFTIALMFSWVFLVLTTFIPFYGWNIPFF